MKTNVTPTTEISLTLTIEEWFSILAVLSKAPRQTLHNNLSTYGMDCFKSAGDKITKQLEDWQKS